jgi:hypothetical protein
MVRILKAFAWLRWRMFINSLEKTGSRDALERFSLAIDRLGPLLAAILLVPSGLILLGLGITAGYALPQGGRDIPFTAVRYMLLAVPLLAVFGPLFLPAADRTNPTRLLLLPIPRSTLYVAQAGGALGDPWNLLLAPLLGGLVIGLAAAGAVQSALVCLAAALLLVALVIGLAALTTSIVHLLVRDRRRGELIALIFLVIVPVVAMMPGLLGGSSRRERGQEREPLLPSWVATAGSRAFAAYPTELFIGGTRDTVRGRPAPAAAQVGGLALYVIVLHGVGFAVFDRLLKSPGASGARRSGPMRAAWGARLPGLSRGASAVALAQLRLALRTPRGRSIFLSPLAAFVIFGALMYRGSGEMELGPFHFESGIGLATFVSFMCLISILPIAMNQFAVDNAGLTLVLLSPLETDELLAGKAAGNALVVTVPVLFCILAALVIFPGGSPALWLALVLGLVSMYLLVAPVAAICSAVFPRAVDMNSIGRGSNAHGASGFLGLLSFAVAGVPPTLLALAATRVLERPSLAPLLLLGWCVVAYLSGRLLFSAARRTFAARRENLAMLV